MTTREPNEPKANNPLETQARGTKAAAWTIKELYWQEGYVRIIHRAIVGGELLDKDI